MTRCGDKSPKWLFLIAPWRENFAVASGEKVAILKIWGRRHLEVIMWDNKVFFSISKFYFGQALDILAFFSDKH